MLDRTRLRFRRAILDIRAGRHVEAYVLFVLGLALAVLGVAQVTSLQVTLAALLVGLSFLVFRSVEAAEPPRGSDSLQDRSSFAPFVEIVGQARELWVYGPTAVNILVNAADIRRHILDHGGRVRVLVQDPRSPWLEATERQLDANLDFRQTLLSSVGALQRLGHSGSLEYRFLAVNPGFSIVVVNPGSSDAFLIVEFHGYRDDNIADRMHIEVHKRDSGKWFAYWIGRFNAMWLDAKAPSDGPEAVPPATGGDPS